MNYVNVDYSTRIPNNVGLTEDARVLIRVHDSGIGIPADKLDAVFTPFTQLGRALNNPVGGTGLGLPIARSLLAASHGRIELVSAGSGAAFRVTLPRAMG